MNKSVCVCVYVRLYIYIMKTGIRIFMRWLTFRKAKIRKLGTAGFLKRGPEQFILTGAIGRGEDTPTDTHIYVYIH